MIRAIVHAFARRRANAERPLTAEEKAASAASYLARHAAKARADARQWAIRLKCAELREGAPSPIAPRETVVAGVRGRASHAR